MDELTRLAVQARRGEPSVMASFIRATQREVYSLCAYLVDEDTAEDLAQETYLRVFRALPDFRKESSARTWLLSITRRVCMDELRRRIRRRRRETLVAEFSTELNAGFNTDRPAPAADDDQGEVRELLSQLPEDRRSAFVLTQILGLSYADAGDICQCPAGTIGSRVARARGDLIQALERGAPRRTEKEVRRDAMD
ncbi:MAG TPA: sigma-70 family RNA polymerase sigma factor [Pseudonocardia sp.]|jgi:RNA polymerase sigma-70 factor (ECF subfamily)|uniref:sigma-70 family RNA polymerase sigma factor n=1 Tax=Pseudonocardia sp. TaxID=60912 RepID=UPI002B946275|nr:sigma-70 family RNA polymerase sigma factor [Pseudonocardia sp.]HTF50308.1 sigma-70 family RNA polymerase sigma factor [Pseudonocardia sp.]